MQQDAAARDAAFEEEHHPKFVAEQFQAWFKGIGGIQLWSQGNIDAPMWQHVMQAYNINAPWDFWNIRDTRTLYDLARYRSGFDYKRDVPREGIYHSAIDDCRHQVKCCHEAFGRL